VWCVCVCVCEPSEPKSVDWSDPKRAIRVAHITPMAKEPGKNAATGVASARTRSLSCYGNGWKRKREQHNTTHTQRRRRWWRRPMRGNLTKERGGSNR
jgi:hypothetical protein